MLAVLLFNPMAASSTHPGERLRHPFASAVDNSRGQKAVCATDFESYCKVWFRVCSPQLRVVTRYSMDFSSSWWLSSALSPFIARYREGRILFGLKSGVFYTRFHS